MNECVIKQARVGENNAHNITDILFMIFLIFRSLKLNIKEITHDKKKQKLEKL